MQKTVESHKLEVQGIVEKLEIAMHNQDIDAGIPAFMNVLTTMYLQCGEKDKEKNLKFIKAAVEKMEELGLANPSPS